MKKDSKYYIRVKSKVDKNICDGDCDNNYGHSGVCKMYIVDDYTAKTWGLFSYCDNAAKKDKKNGFILSEYNE
jgi:hypothetical protein